MTNALLRPLLNRASAARLIVSAALLAAYGAWLFKGASPFAAASRAAGALPELAFAGNRADAAGAIERLGGAARDYMWAQAFDFVFAALVALTAIFAITLASRGRTPGRSGAPRLLLAIPVAYAGAELFENALLALMAAGAVWPEGVAGRLREIATFFKFVLLAATPLAAIAAFALRGRASS